MVEIHLPLATRFRHAMPRTWWPGALATLGAGLVAGTATLGVMESMSLLVYDEPAWKLLRMMAAIARGPSALAPEGEFDAAIVALGLGTHYALSLLYTLALAALLRELPRGAAPMAGLAFGVALYFANLHAFTGLFPWFAEMRTADTLVAHAVFGLFAAGFYCELAHECRTGGDPGA